MTDNQIARFWSKVFYWPPDGCWYWQLKPDRYGYGRITLNGKCRKAHRIAYELMHGSLPPELTIDHLCRNRLCVNPAHLEAVTFGVNTLRGETVSGINSRKTHCIKGHPFSISNTRDEKNGSRTCLTCKRIEARQRWRRNRGWSAADMELQPYGRPWS